MKMIRRICHFFRLCLNYSYLFQIYDGCEREIDQIYGYNPSSYNHPKGYNYYSDKNTFSLNFVSDYSAGRSGFEISYVFVPEGTALLTAFYNLTELILPFII